MAEIFITTPLPEPTIARMRALFEGRVAFGDGEKDTAALIKHAKGARVLVSTLEDPVTGDGCIIA